MIDQLVHDSVAVLARDMVDATAIVAMASFCPRIPAKEPSFTAVKILVDCSGSMAGDSIEAAKRSLQVIVGQFESADQFSLSRFGSSVEHRSRGLWSVNETTRLAARRWVSGLNADLGGTEMESALTSTFALAHTVTSDVLLVTDGEISAIDRTIAAARSSGHRVFVVGIGSSPAESHLRRLAQTTGGACDFVAPGEAVEPAVLRMFARLRSPRLDDVTVVWPDEFTPEWVTSIPQSVFDGDTVNLFAGGKQIPTGTVRLMGRVANDSELFEIACAPFSSVVQQGDSLSRMAVAERLQRKDAGLPAETNAFTRDLALAYQLISDQTNFLLIHERAADEKSKDMPELHQVSQMLAAGWGGVGGAHAYESPALYRASVDASVRFRAVNSNTSFDIPAFSRASMSSPSVFRQATGEAVAENVGATPMSLCSWLRSTSEINWPSSYRELRELGVDRWVVEWLEIGIANKHATAVTEPIVVRSFLHVMAQRETLEMLKLSHDAALGVKGIVRKLKGLFSGVHGKSGIGVDPQLAQEIASALHDMTAAAWPDLVFELNAV